MNLINVLVLYNAYHLFNPINITSSLLFIIQYKFCTFVADRGGFPH